MVIHVFDQTKVLILQKKINEIINFIPIHFINHRFFSEY